MITKFILIFISLYKFSNNIYVLESKDFFKYIDEEKVEKTKLDEIIKRISKGFEEVYAFYTLSNNPPKTGYPDITHNKVNITEELYKIDTNNRNFYNFYQDFLKVFSKVKDGHTTIIFSEINTFTKKIDEYGALIYFPVLFNIKNDSNGNPRMYCIPNKKEPLNKLFRNNVKTFEIINRSKEVPIKAIKGRNPFDFIEELLSQFMALKNPHGTFTLCFNLLNRIDLGLIPLYRENFTDFKVEYDNGEKFETDLLIMLKENIFFNNHNYTVIPSIKNYFLNPNIVDKMMNEFTFVPEIKEYPYDRIKIDKYGKFKFNLDPHINSIKDPSLTLKEWNFMTKDNKLKCREDKDNQVNVYVVRSFLPKSYDDFVEVVEKCSELFDKNNFKTIVIHSNNGGGAVMLSEFLLEMVSPYTSINLYSRIRATQAIKKNYRDHFHTIDKCELQSQIDFFDEFNSANYGNDVKEDLTKPYIMVETELREKSRNLRKKMKNKRKPTDIMVFTDGYSFSATSMFIKYLQYYGGGIVVGYFGNPNKNTTFDSSLSPSGIIDIDRLSLMNDNFEYLRNNYKCYIQFAIYQSFYDKDNFNVPLEYKVTPVDERISLYENYNDSNYHVFVQKAKEIFKKYENKCNPSNTNLYLLDKNCSHGGYQCGKDGEWNKEKCLQFYCDIGYIFDKQSQKCIPDNCSYNGKIYYYIILSLIILSDLIILVMIIYCSALCCCCKKRRNAPEGPLY